MAATILAINIAILGYTSVMGVNHDIHKEGFQNSEICSVSLDDIGLDQSQEILFYNIYLWPGAALGCLLPLIITIVLYIVATMYLRKSLKLFLQMQVNLGNSVDEVDQERRESSAVIKRKKQHVITIKNFACAAAVSFGTYVPALLFEMSILTTEWSMSLGDTYFKIAVGMFGIQSVHGILTPIIYAGMMREYKQLLKKMIRCRNSEERNHIPQ